MSTELVPGPGKLILITSKESWGDLSPGFSRSIWKLSQERRVTATGDVLFPVNTMETKNNNNKKKSSVQEASWAMTATPKVLPKNITPMKNMSSSKIIPRDEWDSSKLPRAFRFFFLSGDVNKAGIWHKAPQWVSDSLHSKGGQERILKSHDLPLQSWGRQAINLCPEGEHSSLPAAGDIKGEGSTLRRILNRKIT